MFSHFPSLSYFVNEIGITFMILYYLLSIIYKWKIRENEDVKLKYHYSTLNTI